jgi:hypothetical protein
MDTYNFRRRRPILRSPCETTHDVDWYWGTWKTCEEGSSGDVGTNPGYRSLLMRTLSWEAVPLASPQFLVAGADDQDCDFRADGPWARVVLARCRRWT